MSIDKAKLNKFKEILKLVDESITKKEFEETIKRIFDFLTSLKEKNQTEFKNLNQKFSDQSEKLKGDNTTSISILKDKFIELINKALKEQENGINWMRDKVRSLKNGKDGVSPDPKKIALIASKLTSNELKPLIPTPDTPIMVAEKLELLKDDNRLKIEAINNLEERLKDLENRPVGGKVGGARKTTYIKRVNLSSQCNGTLKTFILPKDTIEVIGVWGTQFPVNFNPGTDWTFEGRTLTLTSEVSAPATGQTLYALVETLFFG